MGDTSEQAQFLSDALAGLADSPKSLPCKYLYDARGSELFEAICSTDDYYVTRADLALHEHHLPEIAELIGPAAHIIELGSGSGVKTRKLLASLDSPRAYTPIEISAAALAASTKTLKADFPDIDICPLQADYTLPISDEAIELEPPPQCRVVYFPGSTISNFDHDEAVAFLARLHQMAGSNGAVLVGVDLLKNRQRLLSAYDDSEGVTARFNRNLLTRLHKELGAELEKDAFRHEARFNEQLNRIEMHLVASRATRIVLDGREFNFEEGESIHTESSHKYSLLDFRKLAARAGLASKKAWKDPEGLFSMHWLEESVKCEV